MYIYVVTSGDTLYGIAQRYGVSLNLIASQNGLNPNAPLLIGQALIILVPEIQHTVKSGETVYSIAKKYQTSVRALLRNNPAIRYDQPLYPEQTVIISYKTDKRGAILSNGYTYPFISTEQLDSTLPFLSLVTPFTYGFREDGTLIELDTEQIAKRAAEIGTYSVLLISTLEDNGLFNSFLPGKVFADASATEALIDNIIRTAVSGNYRYIDVDFEFLPKEEADNYAAFIGALRNEANKNGISVIVALAPKTSNAQPGLLYEGHLYDKLGQNADYVLLMTYEWGYTYGPPQAVAPIDKVRQVVSYAVSVIDHNKILLGMPNYGYNWKLPFTMGDAASSLGNTQAIELAQKYNQQILFDNTAMTPYFYYVDENGVQHVVWFEDARSVLTKLNLISEYDLAGMSVWNIMRPFPALWQLTGTLYEVDE
ncbi:MAG: LysM peptidoglycan-binding domain-containing protein [Ruminococcaceae bacterium]|nr:LysM peptidoglycan-binding domain-containing protein [Oscillospiraceae bacterium]